MPALPWLHRIRRRLAHDTDTQDAGFSLLEALISFVVFAAVATGASFGIVKALNSTHLTQQRVEAADVAQYFVADAIRTASTIAEIPPPGQTISFGVGADGLTDAHSYAEGEGFKVVETIVYDTGGSCNTGTMFTVNVEVYQAQTSQFLARSDARVACPRV